MRKTIIAAIAFAASCARAGTYTHTTDGIVGVNLKTYAVKTDGKFVLGTGDYSNSEWDCLHLPRRLWNIPSF